MAIAVNPPPQLRMPKQFFDNPDLRGYFERQETILFQLYNRTGGNNDLVNSLEQITVHETNDSDLVLDSNYYGSLITVKATTQDINITMPDILADDIGKSIIILLLDNTFDCYINQSGDDTVLGDTSVLINGQYDAVHFTSISLTEWIIR